MKRRRVVRASYASLLLVAIGCGGSSLEPGEGRLNVEGGSIYYRITGSGSGTPAVLLHGGPGYTSHYLEPLAAALGRDRPVVTYDQLGSGRSEHVTDTTLFRIDRYVRELDSLRSALQLERVHLYGHSWGSMLALEYLATSPPGVVSLTLASPVITTSSWAEDGQALVAALPDSTRAVIAEHLAAGTTASQEFQDAVYRFWIEHVFGMEPPFPAEVDSTLAGYNPHVYETMWGPSEFTPTGNLRDFDRSEVLRDLQIPVLFTVGRYDEARPETVRRFAQLTPSAEVQLFENSAHLPMNTEPDAYAEEVRQFLSRADQ